MKSIPLFLSFACFLVLAAAAAPSAELELSFPSDHFELRVGETVMIPFQTPQAVELSIEYPVSSESEHFSILSPAQMVADKTTGFVRVQGIKPGKGKLKIANASTGIHVTSAPSPALEARLVPQITAPTESSVAWGKIHIGAEVWVGAPTVIREKQPELLLVLPNGETLEAIEVMPPIDGPFWRFIYEVDCDALPSGQHEFIARYKPHLSTPENARELSSASHPLRILPSPAEPSAKSEDFFLAEECENTLETPRGERLSTDPPGIGYDSQASGARFVNIYGSRPEWAVEIDIPANGTYQMILRARGSLAASSFPSLEIMNGETRRRITSGRLVSTNWARLPIGTPMNLKAGKNLLAINLPNSLNYRNRVKRDAFIDRFELRKVPAVSSGSGDAMAMMMEGDSMMAGDGAAQGEAKAGAAPKNLRVAFRSQIHDHTITGKLTVHCVVSATNFKDDKPYDKIITALVINDKVHASTVGRRPQFELYPHDLKSGANSLRLVAVGPQAVEAQSLPLTLHANAESHPEKKLATKFRQDVFDLNRGKWRQVSATKLDQKDPNWEADHQDNPPSYHLLAVDSSEKISLPLANSLSGPHRISLWLKSSQPVSTATTEENPDEPSPEAEGSDQAPTKDTKSAPSPAKLEAPFPVQVTLVLGDKKKERRKLGTLTPESKWSWQSLPISDLPSGPKSIVISIEKPKAESSKKAAEEPSQQRLVSAIAGLSIDAPYFAGVKPPELTLLYPRAGTQLDPECDAVVLSAFDDTHIRSYEILIDGEALAFALPPASPTGLQLLPLVTANLAPGKYQLQVKATDDNGQSTTTAATAVTITAPTDSTTLSLPYERALRLSQRFGFGADPTTLSTILSVGEEEWLSQALSNHASCELTKKHALETSLAYFPAENNAYHVRGRVLSQALLSANPVRDRFVLWAQNHFSTWISKTGNIPKWEEHQAFDHAGFAPFKDLLLISATSPAMMVYLDQQSSLGRQFNENYAREIMELHTLGVNAGYAQEDVTSLAHLLTGWGAQREANMEGSDYTYNYRYSPTLNETEPQVVFGLPVPKASNADRSDERILQLLEMLAARPETAEFISIKLAEHYLAEPPSAELLDQMKISFLRSNGDLTELLRFIARSPDLMQRELSPKFLKPVEFGLATQRTSQLFEPWRIIDLGDTSGRNLFDRATPDGFPEANEENSDSNMQLQKWRFAKNLSISLAHQLPWHWFDEKKMQDEAYRQQLIQQLEAIIQRQALSPASTNACLQVAKHAAQLKDHSERRSLMAGFILMLPENQIR